MDIIAAMKTVRRISPKVSAPKIAETIAVGATNELGPVKGKRRFSHSFFVVLRGES